MKKNASPVRQGRLSTGWERVGEVLGTGVRRNVDLGEKKASGALKMEAAFVFFLYVSNSPSKGHPRTTLIYPGLLWNTYIFCMLLSARFLKAYFGRELV